MSDNFQEILKTRWLALEPRERSMLALGGICVVIFIFYIGIWYPVQKNLHRIQTSLPEAQRQLAWMRVNAAQVKQFQMRRPAGASQGNLLSRFEQAAVSRGLRKNISKMEPDGDTGIRLTIEEVSFNSLVSLLSDLQKQNGFNVESLIIDAATELPGTVSARLSLRSSR
ncbi:MAG: type II secretion system protein M [Gammaproteobacteria bacterium]|nr:type II secretion system protein M [Gammaproteobacteria bacterium]